MKNLIDYILERFISSKNTTFSKRYVLFIPYGVNFQHMKNKSTYNKYKVSFKIPNRGIWELFLIPTEKAKEIYDALPYHELSCGYSTNHLGIYRLPNDIYDVNQLVEILKKHECLQIRPKPHNEFLWERIVNIDYL